MNARGKVLRLVNNLGQLAIGWQTFRAFGNGRVASLVRAVAVVQGKAVDLYPEGEDPGETLYDAPRAKMFVVNKRDADTVN